MRVWGVVFVVLLAAGCSGGSKQNVPKQPPPGLARRCGDDAQGVDAKPVWFRASDNALLDGAEVGDGDVGVVLAHESESDLCPGCPSRRRSPTTATALSRSTSAARVRHLPSSPRSRPATTST